MKRVFLFLAIASQLSIATPYYHITDARNLESIMDSGLSTAQGGKNAFGFSAIFLGDTQPCSGHIHLSNHISEMYLEFAQERDVVILCIELNADEEQLLLPDSCDPDGAFRAPFNISNDRIRVIREVPANARRLDPAESVATTPSPLTAAQRAAIPAEIHQFFL